MCKREIIPALSDTIGICRYCGLTKYGKKRYGRRFFCRPWKDYMERGRFALGGPKEV